MLWLWPLQWGHDQLIVEGGQPSPYPTAASRASMGPRSVDRGRRLPGQRLSIAITLQWGHDQLIVEGEIEMTTETETLAASMGPRSVDRGRLVVAKYPVRRQCRFNGATIS